MSYVVDSFLACVESVATKNSTMKEPRGLLFVPTLCSFDSETESVKTGEFVRDCSEVHTGTPRSPELPVRDYPSRDLRHT